MTRCCGQKAAGTGLFNELKHVASCGDVARDVAYRLYNLCERKGWAQEATAYNGLFTAWPELRRLASQVTVVGPTTRDLFEGR